MMPNLFFSLFGKPSNPLKYVLYAALTLPAVWGAQANLNEKNIAYISSFQPVFQKPLSFSRDEQFKALSVLNVLYNQEMGLEMFTYLADAGEVRQFFRELRPQWKENAGYQQVKLQWYHDIYDQRIQAAEALHSLSLSPDFQKILKAYGAQSNAKPTWTNPFHILDDKGFSQDESDLEWPNGYATLLQKGLWAISTPLPNFFVLNGSAARDFEKDLTAQGSKVEVTPYAAHDLFPPTQNGLAKAEMAVERELELFCQSLSQVGQTLSWALENHSPESPLSLDKEGWQAIRYLMGPQLFLCGDEPIGDTLYERLRYALPKEVTGWEPPPNAWRR